MRVAARMFAERPFHEVRLDEIAAATQLGKGTIYVYFAGKDDLYTTLIAEGIDQLIAALRESGDGPRASWHAVERLVAALLDFAGRFPHLYTLMRSGSPPPAGRLAEKRAELARAIARILRRGVRDGDLEDAHPGLTAEFLLSFVRVALLFPPRRLGKRAIADHILRVLGRGILARKRR